MNPQFDDNYDGFDTFQDLGELPTGSDVQATAAVLLRDRKSPWGSAVFTGASLAVLGMLTTVWGAKTLGRDDLAQRPAHAESSAAESGLGGAVMTAGLVAPQLPAGTDAVPHGTVKSISAAVGMHVRFGQVLARMDDDAYRQNLRIARAALDRAKAAAAMADRRAVQIAEAGVRQAERALERCAIRAPIDGVVIASRAHVGEMIAAGSPASPLFVIAAEPGRMEIHATVRDRELSRIGVGQDVVFTVDELPGREFEGRVAEVGMIPALDGGTLTYPVIIRTASPVRDLVPGMRAQVIMMVDHPDRHRDESLGARFASLFTGRAKRPPVAERQS